MNEANKAIAKSINSGQYFIDARRWYLDKFVGPHVERTFIVVIGSILALAAGIAFLYASNISSYTNQISFLSYNNDIDNTYSYINTLPINISPQLALEKQLVTEYLENRESFKLSEQGDKDVYIKNHSSTEEYNKYLKNISIDNEDSPLLIYGTKFISTVKVIATNFKESKKVNEKIAVVDFEKSIILKNQVQIQKGKAEIFYSFSDIEQLLNNNDKIIDFKVTKYLAKTFN